MSFIRAAGLKTTIVASMTHGVRSAANFVEYMNAPVGKNPNGGAAWAKVRAHNGHPSPYGVTWWELGNEPQLGGERYWMSQRDHVALRQYVFGGKQRQTRQPVGTRCDHRQQAAVSDGSTGQRFQVWYPPVVPGSQTVYVDGKAWKSVGDLETAKPGSRVYEFDPRTGTIHFGGGRHGRAPADGLRVTVTYTSGPHPGFVDFYSAMKRVDPSIKVCSSWGTPGFAKLAGVKHPYDCVVSHLFSRPGPGLDDPDRLYDWLMRSADGLEDQLDQLLNAVKSYGPSRHRPPVIVTESMAFDRERETVNVPNWKSGVISLLHDASLLTDYIDRSLPVASIGTETAALGLQRPESGPRITTLAHLYSLASELVGGRPVKSSVEIHNDNDDSPKYDELLVSATRGADGGFQILTVNRERGRRIAATYVLPNLPEGLRVKVVTLDGPELTSASVPNGRDGLRTRRVSGWSSAAGFRVLLPPHSVTLVRVLEPG